VIAEIQQGIYFRHAHPPGTRRYPFDRIAGADVSFLDHPEIKTRTPVGDHEGRHWRVPHTDSQLKTGDPRLRYFKDGGADTIAIPDANFRVGEPFDRKVLPELAVAESGSLQSPLPISIRVELVHHDRTLLAPVAGEVCLPVTRQVQATDRDAALDRLLPDRCLDASSLPLDFPGQADIHRNEPHPAQ
jgi:hypothetical protein